MTIENCFNIREAVKEEIEKQVKEYIGSVYEQGYENGYEQGKNESDNKLYKLYQELSDAYKTIYILERIERIGAWVGIDEFPHEDWECNMCGCIEHEEYNFCPNCGAQMKKERYEDTD